jgi:hypothetical protein
MHLRSAQALAFDYVAVRIRNCELKDSLRQINCNSRGYHWMLLFLLTRPPDIAISANVFAFSKKPIPSFRAIFSGTQARPGLARIFFLRLGGRLTPPMGSRG